MSVIKTDTEEYLVSVERGVLSVERSVSCLWGRGGGRVPGGMRKRDFKVRKREGNVLCPKERSMSSFDRGVGREREREGERERERERERESLKCALSVQR